MEVTSMYYFNYIHAIQSPYTKKKKMIKNPSQTMLIILLQNPHAIANAACWGGYSKNALSMVPVLYKQTKKTYNFIFVTQNQKWQIKFTNPSKANNLC